VPNPADDSPRLSEAQVCEINGVSQQYRQTLVRRSLVRPAPSEGCTIRDAIELAAIRTLRDHLSSADAALAAEQLWPILHDAAWGDRLEAVYDRQYKRLDVARDDAQLRILVSHGRPVQVVVLTERLAEVRAAFRRVAGLAATSGRQRDRRSGRTAA
jgi:uncharacterized protein (DUF2267 family)